MTYVTFLKHFHIILTIFKISDNIIKTFSKQVRYKLFLDV